tara:strand:- start:3605 stop:5029 length:1425 start_codon:yes stop_codon:yes gene_type:complete
MAIERTTNADFFLKTPDRFVDVFKRDAQKMLLACDQSKLSQYADLFLYDIVGVVVAYYNRVWYKAVLGGAIRNMDPLESINALMSSALERCREARNPMIVGMQEPAAPGVMSAFCRQHDLCWLQSGGVGALQVAIIYTRGDFKSVVIADKSVATQAAVSAGLVGKQLQVAVDRSVIATFTTFDGNTITVACVHATNPGSQIGPHTIFFANLARAVLERSTGGHGCILTDTNIPQWCTLPDHTVQINGIDYWHRAMADSGVNVMPPNEDKFKCKKERTGFGMQAQRKKAFVVQHTQKDYVISVGKISNCGAPGTPDEYLPSNEIPSDHRPIVATVYGTTNNITYTVGTVNALGGRVTPFEFIPEASGPSEVMENLCSKFSSVPISDVLQLVEDDILLQECVRMALTNQGDWDESDCVNLGALNLKLDQHVDRCNLFGSAWDIVPIEPNDRSSWVVLRVGIVVVIICVCIAHLILN